MEKNSEYIKAVRERRIAKLESQGVVNAASVASNAVKPLYEDDINKLKVTRTGIIIPKYFRKKIDVDYGDLVKIEKLGDGLLITKVKN